MSLFALLEALRPRRTAQVALLRGAARPRGLAGRAFEVTGPRREWLGFIWQGDDGWHAGPAIFDHGVAYSDRRSAIRSLS